MQLNHVNEGQIQGHSLPTSFPQVRPPPTTRLVERYSRPSAAPLKSNMPVMQLQEYVQTGRFGSCSIEFCNPVKLR